MEKIVLVASDLAWKAGQAVWDASQKHPNIFWGSITLVTSGFFVGTIGVFAFGKTLTKRIFKRKVTQHNSLETKALEEEKTHKKREVKYKKKYKLFKKRVRKEIKEIRIAYQNLKKKYETELAKRQIETSLGTPAKGDVA